MPLNDDHFTLNKNTFVLLSSEERSKFIAALDQPAQPSAALKELMAMGSLKEVHSPRKI
ncbi:MAG: DUF1778 domain-containing protein [Gammaproteobacteria bacterium]|nr:DUF1778 domain-containing protein [Gammaproteobacteria bacterium]